MIFSLFGERNDENIYYFVYILHLSSRCVFAMCIKCNLESRMLGFRV